MSVRAPAGMELGRTRGPQRRTVAALMTALAPAGAEARTTLEAARRGLGEQNHPRRAEADRELTDTTAPGA
ncbi:hypothetical protein [Streptomyces bikiniensis]|uniref:hypothetical protein n=1 Tax=Streptomyces bikiniensis TaxID=1896 RepID=UPI0004C08BF5|nr:hypothetical protein [Streptomyces bikiniensis]